MYCRHIIIIVASQKRNEVHFSYAELQCHQIISTPYIFIAKTLLRPALFQQTKLSNKPRKRGRQERKRKLHKFNFLWTASEAIQYHLLDHKSLAYPSLRWPKDSIMSTQQQPHNRLCTTPCLSYTGGFVLFEYCGFAVWKWVFLVVLSLEGGRIGYFAQSSLTVQYEKLNINLTNDLQGVHPTNAQTDWGDLSQ